MIDEELCECQQNHVVPLPLTKTTVQLLEGVENSMDVAMMEGAQQIHNRHRLIQTLEGIGVSDKWTKDRQADTCRRMCICRDLLP